MVDRHAHRRRDRTIRKPEVTVGGRGRVGLRRPEGDGRWGGSGCDHRQARSARRAAIGGFEDRLQERRSSAAQPLQRKIRGLRAGARQAGAGRESARRWEEDRLGKRDHAEPVYLRQPGEERRRDQPARAARRGAAQGYRRQNRDRCAGAEEYGRSELSNRTRGAAGHRESSDQGGSVTRRAAGFGVRGRRG